MTGRACCRTGSCRDDAGAAAAGLGTRHQAAAGAGGPAARAASPAGRGRTGWARWWSCASRWMRRAGSAGASEETGRGGGILPLDACVHPSSDSWALAARQCRAHRKAGRGSGREYFSLPDLASGQAAIRPAGTRRIAPPGVAPGTAAAMSAATSSFCQSTPGLDAHAAEQPDDVLDRHVAGRTRREGAAADAARRAVEDAAAGFPRRGDVGHAHAVGVVAMEGEAQRPGRPVRRARRRAAPGRAWHCRWCRPARSPSPGRAPRRAR